MSSDEISKLKRRARALGVQTEFVDSSGKRREASAETLRAMIQLLADAGEGKALVEPVIVSWNGRARTVAIHTNSRERRLRAVLRSGQEERRVLPSRGDGSTAELHLPQLPFGYHELRVEVNGREHRSTIIAAPSRAYAPKRIRACGVFVPMYALASEESWGAGNVSDWAELCAALPSNSVAASLPLLGAFLEKWKCEPSPYSPATRLFWNEFFIDVTRVPEFVASKSAQRIVAASSFQREIASLRRSQTVDYAREMELKRRVLQKLTDEFFRGSSVRRAEFERFLKSRPELERYAAFRATSEKRGESWHAWPERMRSGQLTPRDFDSRTQRYFMFAQWLAQEQMDQVLATCRERGVKFYLDLPLGVNPDGFDIWANQKIFVNDASVGAPPDAFFTKGQDWGFPPLHPGRVREEGYRYVIDYLRFQMRHTGLLRLDHVMGLHRLWWVPRGASAAEGAYVSYNAEEMYAILCLESHRHGTMLVGENLGTVPPEVNRSMKRHGVRSMYVAQYEMQPRARQSLREPPRDCVASINTHDMPMWAAHWRGLDITDRQKLGLLQSKEARTEKRRRAHLRKAAVGFLKRKKILSKRADDASVLAGLFEFLARSKAELVLLNLEDLWLETEPQNTPGTSTERVNWKRKCKWKLDALLDRPDVCGFLQMLAER